MNGYIDSRGAEMDPMAWTEALGIVLSLAKDNQLSESQTCGDAALQDIRSWQEDAISSMASLLEGHGDEIDGFEMATSSREWPDSTWRAERSMDPGQPANAIRICYDLARENAIDPGEAGRDLDLADEADRQQQAFDLTRDFLGAHADRVAGTAPGIGL